MNEEEKIIFNLLKKAVADTFLAENRVNNPDYSTWKGQEIVLFQEDFFKKVKSSFSEKWFYSYFKSDSDKLPRIDMLNILSQYAGYKSWADFKSSKEEKLDVAIIENFENSEIIPENQLEKPNTPTSTDVSSKRNVKKWIWRAVGFIALIAVGFVSWWFTSYDTYKFEFVDDITGSVIKYPIKIVVVQPDQSPFVTTTDIDGRFEWVTSDNLKLIVKSPYHKIDTIIRQRPSSDLESYKLTTDDRALMIHYFSIDNVKDWKKRRDYLNNVIDNDAVIYQVVNESDSVTGIEIYNKEDFINKMTLVTKSLKNVNIMDIEYNQNKKISKLKFKTKL